jgi:hypothetical protein
MGAPGRLDSDSGGQRFFSGVPHPHLLGDCRPNRLLHLAAWLPKPFSISQLLETARTALPAARSPRAQSVPQSGWPYHPSTDDLRPDTP